MLPEPRASRCGSTAHAQLAVPPRITASIRSHRSREMSTTSIPSS